MPNEVKCEYKAYHWIGQGLYFWQDALYRAWQWAEKQVNDVKGGRSEPAVVRAIIDFDVQRCMDLLDTKWFGILNDEYEKHVDQYPQIPPLEQTSIRDHLEKTGWIKGEPHRLDCDMIDTVIQRLEEKTITIQAVRAAFIEGGEIIPSSHLYDLAHVQIAVREKHLSIIKECLPVGRPTPWP